MIKLNNVLYESKIIVENSEIRGGWAAPGLAWNIWSVFVPLLANAGFAYHAWR